jgi:hypothetical protein
MSAVQMGDLDINIDVEGTEQADLFHFAQNERDEQ